MWILGETSLCSCLLTCSVSQTDRSSLVETAGQFLQESRASAGAVGTGRAGELREPEQHVAKGAPGTGSTRTGRRRQESHRPQGRGLEPHTRGRSGKSAGAFCLPGVQGAQTSACPSALTSPFFSPFLPPLPSTACCQDCQLLPLHPPTVSLTSTHSARVCWTSLWTQSTEQVGPPHATGVSRAQPPLRF